LGEVRVGVGVILKNGRGEILVGKRKNSHAPYFSIPGGHLEEGESFEDGGCREILEETGIVLSADDVKVIAVTNDIETWKESGKHYISVILFTDKFSGEPVLMEPEKCSGWIWVDPEHLREPHFEASRNGIECYLKKCCYIANQGC
jgi:ADP-ribose pyrophosphatase YjhB (NUDIX family)